MVEFPYDKKLSKLRRYSLTHSPTHSPTHSLTHSLTHSRSQISGYLKELLNERIFSNEVVSGNTAYSSMIKRIILTDSMKLSVFFGQFEIVDELLHYVLTFLNDPDWEVQHLLAYLLTYSLTYSLTFSLTYSLTHSLTHSLTQSN